MPKPWGTTDLRPWNAHHDAATCIGEVWFQRPDGPSPESALLLKLLYTREPLSIQVHPDDAYARLAGLRSGKSEAWYILDATRGARIVLGLKRAISASKLHDSIEDGSILDIVQWRRVGRDDVISVPAGTIHAIGAGLVAVEVQQYSDVTYRLFDFGRKRETHVTQAVAAAQNGPAPPQPISRRISGARTLLLAGAHFVLERIELPPESTWELRAPGEMWVFVLDGRARIGELSNDIGDVTFLNTDLARICVGPAAFKALATYPGCDPVQQLLHRCAPQRAADASLRTPVEVAR